MAITCKIGNKMDTANSSETQIHQSSYMIETRPFIGNQFGTHSPDTLISAAPIRADMIVSASRRTDIPAFHSEWLMNRLRAGYCMVRNPMYDSLVYRVDLSRRNVDALVFVTKNPAPIVPYLREIGSMGHMSVFEVTITPYGKDLEPNVPPKADVAESFREISDRLGADRCLWRYDPILVNGYIGTEYHRRKFELLCRELEGYTNRCIFSFVEVRNKLLGRENLFRTPTHAEMDSIVDAVKPVADRYGIELTYCCPHYDLSPHGIEPRGCIDGRQMMRLGIPFEEMSTPLREGCRCVKNIDIGAYDTCPHDCVYCYANRTKGEARHERTYDPESEILFGEVTARDEVVNLKGREIPRLTDFFEYTQYGDVGKSVRRPRYPLPFSSPRSASDPRPSPPTAPSPCASWRTARNP